TPGALLHHHRRRSQTPGRNEHGVPARGARDRARDAPRLTLPLPMSMLDSLRYCVRALFHPGAHARDAERELRFHLDLEAAQREHDGAAPEDAEFAARRRLGNKTAVAEGMRLVAGLAWLDATRQD